MPCCCRHILCHAKKCGKNYLSLSFFLKDMKQIIDMTRLHFSLLTILILGAGAFCFGFLGSAQAGSLQAVDTAPTAQDLFVPHKALYKMELVSAKRTSQLADIDGLMSFQWQDDCEGWSSQQFYDMDYHYLDGRPAQLNSQFSTWEAKDQSQYQFQGVRKNDGQVYETLSGHASISKDGRLNAVYTQPKDMTFEIEGDTFLPSAHSFHIINKAREGGKFFTGVLFDGADADGPTDVATFISKRIPPQDIEALWLKNKKIAEELSQEKDETEGEGAKGVTKNDASLLDAPAYRVRYAFFPKGDDTSEMSDYEMTVFFHENGVVSDMVIDYDDFSLRARLIGVEKLPQAACE